MTKLEKEYVDKLEAKLEPERSEGSLERAGSVSPCRRRINIVANWALAPIMIPLASITCLLAGATAEDNWQIMRKYLKGDF